MASKDSRPEGVSQKVLINFVLDKSGSMDGICEATISGFNEFKNDQAKEDGEAWFTLTLFDTHFHTLAEAVPIREVPDLDHSTYRPDGCTALYDAIGHTMRITDDFVVAHKPDQVLFVIMTDGLENASREFDRARIFELIADRQKLNGYEFIYLGANQDSYIAGREMGLRDGRMIDYLPDHEGSREAFVRASHNVRAHRRQGMAQSAAFFTEEMDALGAISADRWKSMSPESRGELIDKARRSGEKQQPRP